MVLFFNYAPPLSPCMVSYKLAGTIGISRLDTKLVNEAKKDLHQEKDGKEASVER